MKYTINALVIALTIVGGIAASTVSASATEDGYHWAYPKHLKYTLKYGSGR